MTRPNGLLNRRILFRRAMAVAAVLALSVGAADARTDGVALVPKNIAAARDRLQRGDRTLRPAFDTLVAEADGLLQKTTPSVLDKTVLAPSADKHDYFSVSPCWWPDPAQPNGRPYIWRDGMINSGNRAGRIDPASFARMSSSVETLALAYYFTSRERYAKKAAQFLRVWFVDPATRMNPHLRYAEMIPGMTSPGNHGIIEFRPITRVLDAVALLGDSYAWPAKDQAEFRTWLADYYRWLTTSEQGIAERSTPNNHGSWYDVQAARLALALHRKDEARAILQTALTIRVGLQIQRDGSQPLELARTNALACSISNVEALFRLGLLADEVGVEWWKHVSPDGGSVLAAFEYLATFADLKKALPVGDDRRTHRSRLFALFAQARQRFDARSVGDSFGRLSEASPKNARWRLLWP